MISVFPSGPLETNAYLILSEGEAMVVDPGEGAVEQIESHLEGAKVKWIALTHSHWDHIADCALARRRWGGKVAIHPLDAENLRHPGSDEVLTWLKIEGVEPDHLWEDGERVSVGDLTFEVMHTPGHSPGSVCLYEPTHNWLISGDLVLCGAIGRTDLATGDPRAMQQSLKRVARLPHETRIFPGHGPETILAQEVA